MTLQGTAVIVLGGLHEGKRPAKRLNQPPWFEPRKFLNIDLDNIKDIVKFQPFPLTSLNFHWEGVWALLTEQFSLKKAIFWLLNCKKKLEQLKSSKLGRQI